MRRVRGSRRAGRVGPALLFVYGTLLRGAGCAAPGTLLRACLVDLGPAYVHARLYDLGPYPGALPSNSPRQRVYGRLCRLRAPRPCLARLDAYEDCDPRQPAPSLFERRPAIAYALPEDRPTECWVYFYNQAPGARPRIPSGRYRPHR